MREMRAFSKQVNAAIVDPGFITKVRKKLALDQREAAEIRHVSCARDTAPETGLAVVASPRSAVQGFSLG